MKEAEPQSPIKNLVSRGGLTKAHWREVIGRLDDPVSENEFKIVYFASSVIVGKIPDTGNYHRWYLGKRHWEIISGLKTKDPIQVNRRFLPWPKTIYRDNPVAVERNRYGIHEQRQSFTLNDYLAEINNTPEVNWEGPQMIRWIAGGWRAFIYPSDPGAFGIPYSEAGPGTLYSALAKPVGPADAGQVLEMWLLTLDDVPNPVKTPPYELNLILGVQAQLFPDKIADRLKARTPSLHEIHGSPMFGKLEREI